jgi:hypothetical protein
MGVPHSTMVSSSVQQDQGSLQNPLLHDVVHLSRKMLTSAQQERWPELIQMEKDRQGMLGQIFSQTISIQQAEAVAAMIRELLAIDREVIALSEAGRQQAAAQMKQLSRQKKAHAAYSEPGK